MAKLPLCKYARDESQVHRVVVTCTLTGKLCPMIRWCPVHNCPRMNENYKTEGCKTAKKEDSRKEGGNS